jgi:hypothetical protein
MVCIIDLTNVVEEAGLATGFFVPAIWYWMNQQLIRCTTADVLSR